MRRQASRLVPSVLGGLTAGGVDLIGSTARVLVARVVGAAAAFGLSLTLARRLGATGSGLYYLAFSTAAVAAVLGRLGLDSAMMRFASTAHAEGDRRRLRSVFVRGGATALAGSVVLAIVVAALAPTLAEHVFSEPDATAAIRIGSLLIPVLALLQIQSQLLKAIERPVLATVVQTVGPPAVATVALLVTSLRSAEGAVAVFIGSSTGWLLVATAALTVRSATDGPRADAMPWKTLMSTALPLLVVSSLQLVTQWSDVVMLGILAEAEQVGVYAPTLQVSALIGLILVAINSIAPPRFAVLHAQGDHAALEQLARATSRLGTLAGVPAVAMMLLLAPWIMGVFGSEFVGGAGALRILAMGQLVNVAVGSVGLLLAMTGYERMLQRTMILAAVVNIALNAILIPLWGVNGAAAATAVSVVGLNAANVWWVRHALGITMFPRWRGRDRTVR